MGYINNGKARSYTIRITQTMGGIPITFYPPKNMLENFLGSGGAITETAFLRLSDADFLIRVNAYYTWLESIYPISLPEDLSVEPEINDPSCLDITSSEEPPTSSEEPPTSSEEPPTSSEEPPTSTEEPPTSTEGPTTTIQCYDCGTTITYIYEGNDYHVYDNIYVCENSNECTWFNWEVYDRPNRFSLYDDSGLVFTTNWKGIANYGGPWGPSLNTAVSGNDFIQWGTTTGRYIMVEAGNTNPLSPISDACDWNLSCDIDCPTTTIETTEECTPIIVRLSSALPDHCDAEYIIKYVPWGEYIHTGVTVYDECELINPVTGNFISDAGGTIYILAAGVVGLPTGWTC